MQNIITSTLFAFVMALVAGLQFLLAFEGAIEKAEGLWITGLATVFIGVAPLLIFLLIRSSGPQRW